MVVSGGVVVVKPNLRVVITVTALVAVQFSVRSAQETLVAGHATSLLPCPIAAGPIGMFPHGYVLSVSRGC